MEWMDIETAPRDGTAILVCYASQYDTNGFLPVAVRWRSYHPNAQGNEEFRDSSGHKVRAITHWMPLPEPPGSKQCAEDAERLNFLDFAIKNNGNATFDSVGSMGCWMELFTTKSGRTKRKPNVRDAIDEAIELARKKGKYHG